MNTELLYSHSEPPAGVSYYDGPEIVDLLTGALKRAGLDPASLSIDDLGALDEFHALGRAATIALADLAGIAPGTRVLDVGAGLGGPARVLAAVYGAHVTGLDATPRFCRAAEMLTRGAGLGDQVRIVTGDALALPFEDGSFDVAWTQAVGQNIADKPRFVAELARVVAPGGRVAAFELVSGPGGPLQFPVPWADGEEQSWLVTADELRELLNQAGLIVDSWNVGPQALATIAQAAQTLPSAPTAGRLGLDLLLPDFESRMAGLAANVAQQRIALVQVVAHRTA
jgi:MPBQ/MSBQ methyltransferase